MSGVGTGLTDLFVGIEERGYLRRVPDVGEEFAEDAGVFEGRGDYG